MAKKATKAKAPSKSEILTALAEETLEPLFSLTSKRKSQKEVSKNFLF